MIKLAFIFAFLFFCLSVYGNTPQESVSRKNSFSAAKYIIPTTLITYGVVTRFGESLQNFDHNIHEEIKKQGFEKIHFDDYLQYAPPVAMYVLNLRGVKSEHNLRDQTIILANAVLLTGIVVHSVKNTTKVSRPNLGAKNSFPSGHTATAFVGAHILYKEYKNISPLIGVGGYLSATTVGIFRMINQRHWFSDVITGAGVGILCSEISYLMLPFYHRLFGVNDDKKGINSLLITPLIGTDFYAVGLILRF